MTKSWRNKLRCLIMTLAGVLASPLALVAWAEELTIDVIVNPLFSSPTEVTPYFLAEDGMLCPYCINLDGDLDDQDADEVAHSEYWIGVQLGDVPDLAKSQLNLKHGLATIAVMPDSPALKAGVEAHDILLRANDKQLERPVDLVRAVNEAKDQVIKLSLLRHGKEQTIEITPAKRPQPIGEKINLNRVEVRQEGQTGPELAQLERALQALQKAAPGEDRLGLWFVRPPILAQDKVRMAMKGLELPENVSITISKTGSQPAQITVKRGDQKWETTEDKLDAIPEELRGAISHALGKRHAMAVQAHVVPGVQGLPGLPGVQGFQATPGVQVIPRPAPTAPEGNLQRRVIVTHGADGADAVVSTKLDLIIEKLKRLESQVEQLQKK